MSATTDLYRENASSLSEEIKEAKTKVNNLENLFTKFNGLSDDELDALYISPMKDHSILLEIRDTIYELMNCIENISDFYDLYFFNKYEEELNKEIDKNKK